MRRDEHIGVCPACGHWFGLDDQNVIACPEPGCESDVLVYAYDGRARYLMPAPPGWAASALHGKGRGA